MKMASDLVIYEVVIKQKQCAILDISVLIRSIIGKILTFI